MAEEGADFPTINGRLKKIQEEVDAANVQWEENALALEELED
jgi:hypothetical protein